MGPPRGRERRGRAYFFRVSQRARLLITRVTIAYLARSLPFIRTFLNGYSEAGASRMRKHA